MLGSIEAQQPSSRLRLVQRDDIDLVPCQGAACGQPGVVCRWCHGTKAVLRTVAETLGWMRVTTNRTIGTDLRASLDQRIAEGR